MIDHPKINYYQDYLEDFATITVSERPMNDRYKASSAKKNKNDDGLWKGILESLFDDFLDFFFQQKADEVFDMKRGFGFLDKELQGLFPSGDTLQASKRVDKLVKVYSKAGEEKWMLIHIEVQGYRDKEFAKRMFTYFFRILDKYEKPVTAIAIFTDRNKSFEPNMFTYEFLGTKAVFQYKTYKILSQNEEELAKSNNPFATVIQTVLLSIKSKKLNDDTLLLLKSKLAKSLFEKNLPKKKISDLLTFLKLSVHFANRNYNQKFDRIIDEITNNDNTMGIRELVLERAKMEGLEKGMEKGMEKGRKKERKERNEEIAKNMIEKMKFSDTVIAEALEVTVDYVKTLRLRLNGNNPAV